MKLWSLRLAVVFAYAAAVYVASLVVPVQFGPWTIAALSVALALVALFFARMSALSVAGIVALITLVLPLGILMAIGLPIYGSWTGALSALASATWAEGWFAAFELALPLLATLGAVFVSSRVRSNRAAHPDAREAA